MSVTAAPGVAIAISLVSPLAVVGITAQVGDFDGSYGAFQLFAFNMLAMIVAGSILLLRMAIRERHTIRLPSAGSWPTERSDWPPS